MKDAADEGRQIPAYPPLPPASKDGDILPRWKHVYDFIMSLQPPPDTLFTHAWFYAALELSPPWTATTYDEVVARELERLKMFQQLRTGLLVSGRIHIESSPGRGYVVVAPQKQTRVAMRDASLGIVRELKKCALRITHLRTEELTDAELRENRDARLQLAALAGFHKQSIGNSHPSLPEETDESD